MAGFFRWRRADRLAAGLVAFAAIGLLLPLRSRSPASWDSVLFALGLERYDVAASRPQAPGDPLYVALGKLFRLGWPSPNDALVTLSIALTVVAALLLFDFVRAFAGRPVGLAAALIYLCSPVVLSNGTIATSYPGDAALSLALAMLAWTARGRPAPWHPYALGAALSLATGFRQSLAIFLGPLVLWALVAGQPWPTAVRRAGQAAASAAVAALAWVPPLLAASGGWQAYLRWNAIQSREAVTADPVWRGGLDALRDHAGRLAFYLHWDALAWLAAAAAAGLLLVVARGLGRPAAGRGAVRARVAQQPWVLLAVWVAPATLFYCLVFSGWDRGPTGYALVLLPALVIALALTVASAMQAWRPAGAEGSAGDRRPQVLAAACLLLASPFALGAALTYHQQEVGAHDAWMASWSRLGATYPPSNTTVLGSYSWAFAEWLFPDHVVWGVKPVGPHGTAEWYSLVQARHHEVDQDWYRVRDAPPPGTRHLIPNGTANVVLMDFQLAGENGEARMLRPDVQVQERFLPDGWRILLFHPDASRPAIEDYLQPTPNLGAGG